MSEYLNGVRVQESPQPLAESEPRSTDTLLLIQKALDKALPDGTGDIVAATAVRGMRDLVSGISQEIAIRKRTLESHGIPSSDHLQVVEKSANELVWPTSLIRIGDNEGFPTEGYVIGVLDLANPDGRDVPMELTDSDVQKVLVALGAFLPETTLNTLTHLPKPRYWNNAGQMVRLDNEKPTFTPELNRVDGLYTNIPGLQVRVTLKGHTQNGPNPRHMLTFVLRKDMLNAWVDSAEPEPTDQKK